MSKKGGCRNNDHQICIMYVLRRWDHKTRKWYYHSSPQSSTVHNGYTGGLLVGLMVILLWLYSFYRLWMVWAYTLNFDGVSRYPLREVCSALDLRESANRTVILSLGQSVSGHL